MRTMPVALAAAMVLVALRVSPAAAEPPWSPPQALGRAADYVEQPAIGFGSDGTGRRSVREVDAFVARPRRGFGPRLIVGPQNGFTNIAAAVNRAGKAVVAWGTQDGGEEANTPWTVRAATLPAGARTFRPAQTLYVSQGIDRPAATVALGLTDAGIATVAWSGVSGTRPSFTYPVLASTSDGAGRFGVPQEVAPNGALGDLALARDGRALLTWARVAGGSYQITDQVFAALRPAGATAFGPPEAVAPPDVASEPHAAFDPVTGRPTVVWSARPNGHDPSLGVGTTGMFLVSTRS